MKNNILVGGLMLLAGVSLSGVALADHGHWHGHDHGGVGVGFYFGAPYMHPYDPYPYYYPYPYSYYPPVVAVPVPAQPSVYIEQGSPPPAAQQAPQTNNYWYHCDRPDGYYPYIKECPSGWQKVVPTPPPQ